MASVGIIANPESGKDIRRLVGLASSFSNHEKVLILRRVLSGLAAAGVREVVAFGDAGGLGAAALEGLKEVRGGGRVKSRLLDLRPYGEAEDSTRAAERLREEGATCIVVLGGDGTCRAVAKGCGRVPIVPLSTGTNNAFPRTWEGTVAGLGAGLFTCSPRRYRDALDDSKRFRVQFERGAEEMALIDVALLRGGYAGARAIWELDGLEGLALTQGRPGGLGLSSIGASLDPVGPEEPFGLWIEFERGRKGKGKRVISPIGPGQVALARISRSARVHPGKPIEVEIPGSRVLAFDGEREHVLEAGERISISLDWKGPRVLDIQRVLAHAARRGHLELASRNGVLRKKANP
ncbi:MAG: NAD(+)/NADH kinase [bacterium]|nr:NAD(+)/NADH kinase [bacterium]